MNAGEHADFLEAIRAVALVQDSDAMPIIQSETTGERASWLFDFRALILQPKWLDQYAELFWEQYADRYPFQVGAMETAGIGLVAAIVMKGVQRGTPVSGFFIRKSRKRQGLMKQIEGTLTDESVILVDDLINGGATFTKQLNILERAGKHVSDMCAIVAFRDKSAYTELEKKGTRLHTFFTLQDFGIPLLVPRQPVPSPTLQWKFSAPQPSFHLVVHKSAPAVDAHHVYFGTDAGTFYALNKMNGSIIWQFQITGHPRGKGILSSPVLHADSVYFGAYDGAVYALDCMTGAMRWKHEDADWVGSSPTLWPEKNILFIGLEYGLFKKRGGIAAIDIRTGRRLWQAVHPEFTHGSPLVIPQKSLVTIGSNDGVLYTYGARDGKERWRYRTGGSIMLAPAYHEKSHLIVCTSLDGKLHALDLESGTPRFAYETGGGIYAAPLVHDQTAYIASFDKYVYAVDLTNGKLRWSYATGGRIFASPAYADESVWAGSNDGALYELDPENGKLRSLFQSVERIVTKIASSDGYIYFATVANELFCIKGEGPSRSSRRTPGCGDQ